MEQNPQSQLKLLIAQGKEQGYLTYAEVNDHLPEELIDTDQIEDIIQMINDMGIQVLDVTPDANDLMLNENIDNIADEDVVEEAIKYIRENDNASVRFYQGNAFDVSAPNFVELKVSETEPGVKGDTASGANKPAVVETGAVINVPLFVNIGDTIKIDTRTGEYLSRV